MSGLITKQAPVRPAQQPMFTVGELADALRGVDSRIVKPMYDQLLGACAFWLGVIACVSL